MGPMSLSVIAPSLHDLAEVTDDAHVVVDRTAALIHGVDVFTFAEHDLEPPIETCAVRGRTRTRRPTVRGRVRDLAPGDVMTLAGVRVTTPLRTALDLGCCLHRRDAYAAMNAMARLHDLTPADFAHELPRFKGRRGVVQLKELVPLVDSRFESIRESWTFLAIHDAGLPDPEPQFWVEVEGVPTFRLDLAYPHLKVCVEYDGEEDHARTTGQREHDERRRRILADAGWTVIVVRRGDFTGERLDAWLSQLRGALNPTYTNRRW